MADDWGPYADEREAVEASFLMVRGAHPEWTPAGWLVATAIGWTESRFGVTPDWQFPDGTPSFNWGAAVGTGGKGHLEHPDKDKDGKPIVSQFAAFFTPEDGLTYWLHAMPPEAIKAAQQGNARGVSEAMYAHCLFTGTKGADADRIDAYAQLIVGAAGHVRSFLNPKLLEAASGPAEPNKVLIGRTVGLKLGNCPTHTTPKSPSTSVGFGDFPWWVLLLLLAARRR